VGLISAPGGYIWYLSPMVHLYKTSARKMTSPFQTMKVVAEEVFDKVRFYLYNLAFYIEKYIGKLPYKKYLSFCREMML
jgi:hypothetical protein